MVVTWAPHSWKEEGWTKGRQKGVEGRTNNGMGWTVGLETIDDHRMNYA